MMMAGTDDGTALVDKLAFILMQDAFLKLSATLRDGDKSAAGDLLNNLEQRLADVLTRFRETPVGAARPDIIAAVALRVRSALRAGESNGGAVGNQSDRL